MQEKSSRQCCLRTHCWIDRGEKKIGSEKQLSGAGYKLHIFVHYRFVSRRTSSILWLLIEADAELAYLSTSGRVDVVLTEDSDLLAYGCKKVPVS